MEFNFYWSETITEQQNVFLQRKPSFGRKMVKWVKTEELKDEFSIRLGSHEIAFVFGFTDKASETPKIRIEGTEAFSTTTELRKLSVDAFSVAGFASSTLGKLQIIVPIFISEKKLVFS